MANISKRMKFWRTELSNLRIVMNIHQTGSKDQEDALYNLNSEFVGMMGYLTSMDTKKMTAGLVEALDNLSWEIVLMKDKYANEKRIKPKRVRSKSS